MIADNLKFESMGKWLRKVAELQGQIHQLVVKIDQATEAARSELLTIELCRQDLMTGRSERCATCPLASQCPHVLGCPDLGLGAGSLDPGETILYLTPAAVG